MKDLIPKNIFCIYVFKYNKIRKKQELVNYNTALLSNSQIENIFYKRLFLLYIPSLVFIISLFSYIKSKRKKNMKESNIALFLISAPIFFI